MPAHLRDFEPLEWGCGSVFQPDPEWQQARAAWRRARQQWLDEHHVDVLAELRAEHAQRHARMRREAQAQDPA